jgi:hypothetical protein
MRTPDRKLHLLAGLCRPDQPVDLALLGRLVEVTEHPAGALVAPAGCDGRWVTRVVAGEVATLPVVSHWRAPAVLTHGPETALVATTDVVLLTVSAADLPHVAALLPQLSDAPAAPVEVTP